MSDKISTKQMENVLKVQSLQLQLLQEQIEEIANGEYTDEEKFQKLSKLINLEPKESV